MDCALCSHPRMALGCFRPSPAVSGAAVGVGVQGWVSLDVCAHFAWMGTSGSESLFPCLRDTQFNILQTELLFASACSVGLEWAVFVLKFPDL